MRIFFFENPTVRCGAVLLKEKSYGAVRFGKTAPNCTTVSSCGDKPSILTWMKNLDVFHYRPFDCRLENRYRGIIWYYRDFLCTETDSTAVVTFAEWNGKMYIAQVFSNNKSSVVDQLKFFPALWTNPSFLQPFSRHKTGYTMYQVPVSSTPRSQFVNRFLSWEAARFSPRKVVFVLLCFYICTINIYTPPSINKTSTCPDSARKTLLFVSGAQGVISIKCIGVLQPWWSVAVGA